MNRPFRTAVFASALALGLAVEAGAAQLVTFTRGHSIVVQAAEKRGNWYYFTLEGGGEMGVPVKQVARMEEYDLPPAAAAPQGPGTPEPPRVTAIPEPPPAPAGGTGGSPPPEVPAYQSNGVDPAAADQAPAPSAEGAVAPPGDEDWRSKVKMGVGGRNQGGGTRKPGGMGPWGANRQQGQQGATNPFNRRNKPPQQPAPPQQ